jgi:ABC-2 type transport system permease protein
MSNTIVPRRRLNLFLQLVNLTLIQLYNWRWSWVSTVVTGVVAPLVTVIGLGKLAEGRDDTAVSFLFIGSLVLGLCFENQNKVASHFAFQRETGALTFFAALPIRQSGLVLASSMAFFVLSIPALMVTTLLGAHLLDLTLNPHPLLLIVVPVAILPMAALGTIIGTYSKNLAQAGAFSVASTMITVVLGGVLVPPALLPFAAGVASWLSPATYVASALRQALVGPVTPRVFFDMAMLLAFGTVGFLVAGRRVRWKSA